MKIHRYFAAASVLALTAAQPVRAQAQPGTAADTQNVPASGTNSTDANATTQAPPPSGRTADKESAVSAPGGSDAGQEIVVTGIRASLQTAADIKRSAQQVVDSIVADDIGKLPDPTTAAALQRIPGIQVVVGDNNEIVNPIIRGLGDVLTTLDGREIFTGDGRGFAFQDLPAEALAGADVYKSNSADLIEGGVAGLINLKLHKPFDFKGLTIAGNARGTYAKNADKVNPAVGLLVADRWNTEAGEIGALVDVSWSSNKFNRPIAFNCDQRSTNHGPAGAPNVAAPTCVGGLNQFGTYKRPQVNGSLQWKPSDSLQLYADGLYAGYRNTSSTGFILDDLFSGTALTNVTTDSNCGPYAVSPAGFYDPNGATEQLCNATSLTSVNPLGFTSDQAHRSKNDLYLGAVGAKYDNGRLHLAVDASYEHSVVYNKTFIIDVGKRLNQVDVVTNDKGGTNFSSPNNPLGDPTGYAFTNGLYEDINKATGSEYAVKADGKYDLDTIVDYLQVGGRYAHRKSDFRQFAGGPGAPGGPYVTLVDSVGLPNDFLTPGPGVGRIDGGAPFLLPNRSQLLDEAIEDKLRALFGAPTGEPAYDPTRNFSASERTYAGYAQAHYKFDLGDSASVDGLVGVRYTRTTRTISGAGVVSGQVTPATGKTTDSNWLPNASARLKLGNHLQARFDYARALSRPDFGSLNPGLNYIISTNPNIINSGSSGNPNLKPQISDNLDATLEYYFTKNGFIAVALYHKDIKNRIVSGVAQEAFNGVNYNIARPRNLGSAKLKGVEVSGQTFFDFLPGPLSGIGVFGNFTYADSKVTTKTDELYGFPIQGVSKYNYNAGLLYEKGGLSGRLVYTYRSHYYDEDRSGVGVILHPLGQSIFLNGVRPNGRLDFGVNYDLTKNITVSVDGTNVTRAKYRSYYDITLNPRDYRYDDSSYSVGVRFRF